MSQTIEMPRPRLALRHAIAASGMHAWEVGLRAELGESRLSRIVNGRSAPRFDEVQRLAKVLGVDVDTLFPGES